MKRINNIVQLEKQSFTSSVRTFLPDYSIVPLNMEKDTEHVIREGDTVKEGEYISSDTAGCFLHSPVPGTIEKITTCTLPDGNFSKAVKIKLGGSFSFLGKIKLGTDWKSLSPEKLLLRIKNGGVPNTFSSLISLADQIESCQKGELLVVRAFDEDPSCITDSFTYTNFTHEVTEGAVAVAMAMQASGIIFVLPKQKDKAYSVSGLKFPHMICYADNSRYPSGTAENLISEIKKSVSPKESFARAGRKSIFIDALTAYNAYNCIEFGLPVLEQIVHVSGTCLNANAVFRVRLGTTFASIVEQCGGFIKAPSKIIVNGLMTGFELSSLDIPVTKSVKSIIFLAANELDDQTQSSCIRCGRCRTVCPQSLYPDLIYNNRTNPVLLESTLLCSSCSLCNSACPSRIPLSQTITVLRKQYENKSL